ncbi:caspase family protein [Beijerinckia mobilis]|uniref:caspase family protein n=1 Tax=Beijerinckia mobilis TaxID=231434 RepID=UPI000A88A4B0|nr:caspase family protein [Beijerinckia mobilis]
MSLPRAIVTAAFLSLVPLAAAAAATRAIVIGVDMYRQVPQLRGATADARDIESALRRHGATDITSLLDGDADRASVLRALDRTLERTGPGDTVIVSFAGHGAQEPEHFEGSQPDGLDTVFLLANFDPRDAQANGEKLLQSEFNHYIRAFESKGARATFIADASSGKGLTREVDPRAATIAYRSVAYTAIPDRLQPVATGADAALVPADFERSIFLAAADKQSKAPEIEVPGEGYRGALSYAVSRALDGAADTDGDGLVTTDEFLAYVRQFTYQLSDQRQNVVVEQARASDPHQEVVAELHRGVSVVATGVRPTEAAPTMSDAKDSASGPASGGLQIRPLAPKSLSIAPGEMPVPARLPLAVPPRPKEPIRLALSGAGPEPGFGQGSRSAFDVVGLGSDPDVIWDSLTKDVIAGGDVLAHNIEAKDLNVIIDRAATVRWLKLFAGRGPQSIRVSPSDGLHRKGEKISVSIGGMTGRNLVLFNLTGNGSLQFLYPLGSDPPVLESAEYHLNLTAREPFGADQIVAITSSRRNLQLEQALRQLDQRRDPARIIDILSEYAAEGALVGTVGVFTAR